MSLFDVIHSILDEEVGIDEVIGLVESLEHLSEFIELHTFERAKDVCEIIDLIDNDKIIAAFPIIIMQDFFKFIGLCCDNDKNVFFKVTSNLVSLENNIAKIMFIKQLNI